MNKYIQIIVLGLMLFLEGCSGQGFHIKHLAKTDIDMVADAHYQMVDALLKELTVKLYKRNPKYLGVGIGDARKADITNNRIQQLFGSPEKLTFSELPVNGTNAIELALAANYEGDRIFALMAGLTTMIRRSYGFQSEFFIYSELDEQQLYYSARNLEIALWRITTYKDGQGQALILTNSMGGDIHNLSYERLFGKLIALQDMLGKIIAGKNQRMIKTIAQNVATMAFIPI